MNQKNSTTKNIVFYRIKRKFVGDQSMQEIVIERILSSKNAPHSTQDL